MTSRCLVLLLVLTLACGASAEGERKLSATPMKATLHAVITSQLAAFRKGDFETAYGFAAPEIRAAIPQGAFEQMVKVGYPLIAASASASCGLTFDNGDEAVVNVHVVGPDRQAADYQYLLKRTGETWQISGVVRLQLETIEV